MIDIQLARFALACVMVGLVVILLLANRQVTLKAEARKKQEVEEPLSSSLSDPWSTVLFGARTERRKDHLTCGAIRNALNGVMALQAGVLMKYHRRLWSYSYEQFTRNHLLVLCHQLHCFDAWRAASTTFDCSCSPALVHRSPLDWRDEVGVCLSHRPCGLFLPQ